MFTSRVVPRLLRRATCALRGHGDIVNGCAQVLPPKWRNYSTAADNAPPPRWVQLVPELDDALVPRKWSVSPLESWLSLSYSLPALLEDAQSQEDARQLEEKVLPPIVGPVQEDSEGSATPLSCKNVLKTRRRKMNRHKYKQLLKRTKFLKAKVLAGRGKKKQKRFEKDLKRIWKRAGLKTAPERWKAPNLFINQYGNKRD